MVWDKQQLQRFHHLHFVSEALPRCLVVECFAFPSNPEAVLIPSPLHPCWALTWDPRTNIAPQGWLPYERCPKSIGSRDGSRERGRFYVCCPNRVWPIPPDCVARTAYSCPLLVGLITFQGELLRSYKHHSWRSNDLEYVEVE